MNRLNIFIFGLSFAVAVFTACNIEKLEVDEFCSECDEYCFADLENFHKTAPSINDYLSTLPKSMSDEQKLQALVEWLCLQPCIVSAKLEHVYTYPSDNIICRDGACPPGTGGSIAILLADNGLTRELTLNIWGEKSKPMIASNYSYPKPKEVRVYFTHPNYYQFAGTITIPDVFDFINLFDHKVQNIYNLGNKGYFSSLPKDRLDYIVNGLEAKPYFSRVHGYWDDWEKELYIDLVMSNMENKAYQADWFKTMNDYKITEIVNIYRWFIIDFEVPDGKEREWIEKFSTHKFVSDASFNYGYQSMIIE